MAVVLMYFSYVLFPLPFVTMLANNFDKFVPFFPVEGNFRTVAIIVISIDSQERPSGLIIWSDLDAVEDWIPAGVI